MKADNLKDILFKRKLLIVLGQIFIWLICAIVITFLVMMLGSVSNFQWLYDTSESMYYSIKAITNNDAFPYLLAFIIWFIGIIFIVFRLIKKDYLYINEIVNATNKLVDKNTEYVSLPAELVAIEKHLNHLKRESEKNEKLAKENEQRKNDLVVYLAHDLKTPLTSLIGYLSLLNEIKDMPKKQREKYLKIVLDTN